MSKIQWLLSRLRKRLWVRVSLFALFGVAVAGLASLSNQLYSGTLPFDISNDATDSPARLVATSSLVRRACSASGPNAGRPPARTSRNTPAFASPRWSMRTCSMTPSAL
ncbi:MAG TPA: hypothetical protein VK146_02360, partial [Tabrizicola sp.]|nr:hypothetical protein [Tabrizicola sp.]